MRTNPQIKAQAKQVGESLYSASEVAQLFELPEGRLRYWSQTGFIIPSSKDGARRFYTFRDLVSVKVAKELLDAGLPLQRVRRSLDALKLHLPEVDDPLSKLRIRGDIDRILVDDGDTTFEANTGQLLLDFDLQRLRTRIAQVLKLPWVDSQERDDEDSESPSNSLSEPAYEWFVKGQAAELRWSQGVSEGRGSEEDPDFVAAKTAYECCVERNPDFAPAWTNLGSLLAQVGDFEGARDAFDQALRCEPGQAEAQCNLAELALRSGERELAVEGYREVLRQHPDHFEAHYGLARGLIASGARAAALAHLERFCRAVRAQRANSGGHLEVAGGSSAKRDPDVDFRYQSAQQAIKRLKSELK